MSESVKGFRMSLFSAGGLVLVLLILVLLNFIFSRVNLRLDATEDKLYSLSAGTQKILSGLKEDVVIKVFYSKSVVNVPTHIKNYAKRMLDFLSEYEQAGNGRVKVEVYDPKLDSDEEEWAQKYGIEAVDLPTGDRIYFGMTAVSADQEETIKMMDPAGEQRLEYDITRMISRIQTPNKPKIGILSGLPVMGQAPNPYSGQPQQPPWQFVTELQKTYEISPIAPSAAEIDDDIDLLMIIHPKGFSDQLLFAVDQYVLKGGNVMVFVDPFSTLDGSPGAVKASSLDNLFKAWGVSLASDRVLADMGNLTRVRTVAGEVEDNPFWLSLTPESFNLENIITSKLEKIILPAAGALSNTAGKQYNYEPLIQSSTDSMLQEALKVRQTANEIRRDFKPSNKKFDLAAKISGVFSTAFPEGKPVAKESGAEKKDDPAAEQKSKEPVETLKKGKKPVTIIIIADTDFLYDGYYVQKQNFLGFEIARIFNDNLNLLLNATEMLSGGQDLISIRSRGKFEKPFTRVEALEKKAQLKWLDREQELMKKVEETNRKLEQLEQQKDASQKLIISKEQEAEIQKFQAEKLRIRKELKTVRKNLRADIEALGATVKLINIFLMPLLVCLAGVAFAIYKRKRSLG